MKTLPVCATMCATCPWRKNSKYAFLKKELEESATQISSRICHSTGSNAINHRTGKPSKICRGARNVQLQMFYRLGLLKAPTDAAWASTLRRIRGRPRTKRSNPKV